MKIQPAASERASELWHGDWHSVAFSMVQLHGHLQTPVVRAKLGVSRGGFGRACPSPSAGRTGRPSLCCVKPAQPNLGVFVCSLGLLGPLWIMGTEASSV